MRRHRSGYPWRLSLAQLLRELREAPGIQHLSVPLGEIVGRLEHETDLNCSRRWYGRGSTCYCLESVLRAISQQYGWKCDVCHRLQDRLGQQLNTKGRRVALCDYCGGSFRMWRKRRGAGCDEDEAFVLWLAYMLGHGMRRRLLIPAD